MFSKFRAFFIMILACLCLVSIGFASWITSFDITNLSLSSSILVDDVFKYNDYIIINETNIFDIYTTGFVDKDKNISNTGKITANFTINLKECFNKLNSIDKLNFSIRLETSNNSNLFKNAYLTSSISLSVNNISYQPIADINDKTEKYINTLGESFSDIDFELTKGEDTVNVLLEYQFILKDNTDFNDIYEMLNNDNFSIAISARFNANE